MCKRTISTDSTKSFHMFLAEGGGWSLRIEQGAMRKFAEMTLKRSGSFISLTRNSFAARPYVGCVFLYYIFVIFIC